VTGGSGFIGTNLVASLVAKGHALLSVDRKQPKCASHAPVFKQLDILDGAAVQTIVADFEPSHICHLAARTDLLGKSPKDYEANTTGTVNVMEAARKTKSVRRVLFASSRFVCRTDYIPKHDFDYCPHTPYGESKIAMEKAILSATDLPFSWCIVRPTSIWGPWFDEPYKTFFLSIQRDRYMHPGCLHIYKSFGYVGNTIFQMEKMLQADDGLVHKKLFYLADYEPIDVRAWANEIQQQMMSGKIRSVPVPFLMAIARVGDVLKLFGWSRFPLTSFRLNNLLCPMVYNLEPAKQIVGPLPFSMQAGVQQTVQWLNAEKTERDGVQLSPKNQLG